MKTWKGSLAIVVLVMWGGLASAASVTLKLSGQVTSV